MESDTQYIPETLQGSADLWITQVLLTFSFLGQRLINQTRVLTMSSIYTKMGSNDPSPGAKRKEAQEVPTVLPELCSGFHFIFTNPTKWYGSINHLTSQYNRLVQRTQ